MKSMCYSENYPFYSSTNAFSLIYELKKVISMENISHNLQRKIPEKIREEYQKWYEMIIIVYIKWYEKNIKNGMRR
jgi:hypothetical protein